MDIGIQADSLTFAYPGAPPAVQEVSFSLRRGECLLIVGHNGAGKSTLLKLLNGILRPSSGSLFINGEAAQNRPVSELASLIAVTFQNPGDQLFATTVRKEVAFGPENLKRPNADELVRNALHALHLSHCADEHPYDLPLPTRKLVTIASALAMGTPHLAFDEPTAGLSHPEKLLVAESLATVCNDRTLLIVSHDLQTFLPLASSVLVLYRGRVLFSGSLQSFIDRNHHMRKAGVRLPFLARLRRLLSLPVFASAHPTRK
jgi:energy-coupling factor transport system ATP-binding protein